MSKFIDISVVFDTATLETKYANPSHDSAHPTGIQHADAFMVAPSVVVQSGQATADLTIKALVGDTIRWRSESLSGNTDQSAVIYKIVKYSGVQVTSDPTMLVAYPTVPIPNAANPTTYTAVNTQADVYMNCNVLIKGTEGYQVWFYIVNKDQNTGALTTFGYYYWDPTIVVPA
jgi:Inclusion body protein.